MGNPRLLAWVLIRTGKTMEMRGQLDQALATYQEAYELLDTRVKFRGRLIHSLAYLKHQMDDDRMALEYLQEPATTDDMDVACELELVRGWIAAYAYDLDYAIAKADGVSAILSNHAVIVNQAAMLRGLACLLRGEVYPLMLNGLRQAVDFYTRQRMLVEESQSRLLLAWALTLTGNSLEAQPLVGRVEAIIEQLGHAALIYRLYQVSLAVLGGYWKRETLIQIESALGHYALSNDRRVRVYALGVPRIFVGNQELKQRDRYGRVGVRILLYMLENRQAYRDEIIEAVYPETDPDTGSARFHKVMSDFKQLLGVPNWYAYSGDNQMYIVREDFPHYYDADDFNRTVETFFRLDTSAQKLSLALRLINLYDVFAKGMEGEVFEELRRLYEGRFMNMLSHAEEGLTNLTTQLPPHWYQQLSRELLRFTS
jgi:hypothetical protein